MRYSTVASIGKGVYKSRGSKFYSFIHPLKSSDDHRHLITIYRNRYPESCHVCSSYRILLGSRIDEFSGDDGEPKGSAGTPILNQLRRNNLINVGAYVVRIFGGSLLGISGLIESYSESSLLAIDSINHLDWRENKEISFSLSYKYEGLLKAIIKEFNAAIINDKYSDRIEILVTIDIEYANVFIEEVKNSSSGKIIISAN